MWHLRLGHIGHGGLDAIVKQKLGVGIDITSVNKWELCNGCALGKQTRVSFQSTAPERAKNVLDVVHSDVCGPMQTSTFSDKRYFVTFIDDKSRFCVVFLLRSKSEVLDKFVQFVKFAETQTGKRVKVLRSDNGGEYVSNKFAAFCRDRGIVQQFTPPYTPQLNGVAERMNRTLVESARCMLEHAGLSKQYWGEAVMTATFLRNRCPTRAIGHDKSPHEVWTQKKPLLKNLKVFGCHAYVHVPSEKRSKLDARSVLCRFLGYSDHEKAYRFEELSSGRIVVSRDAQFMEDTFDSGKRGYAGSKTVEFRDADGATDSEDDDRDDDYSDQDMGEQPAEPASTHERPTEHSTDEARRGRQCQDRRTSGRNGSSDKRQVSSHSDRCSRSSRMSSTHRGPSAIRGRTRSKVCRSHPWRSVTDAWVVQVEQVRRQHQVQGHRSMTCRRYSRRLKKKKKKKSALTSCIQWEICRRRSSRRWNPATRASGWKRATPSSSR